jgi:SSS family solute:Na+ symporter
VTANLIAAIVGTLIARAVKHPDGTDATAPSDYAADEGDPRQVR